MNTKIDHNSWSDMKAKIKTRWSRLSDYELETFKDNLDRVSAQVQKTYGIDREQAEREFNDFKLALQPSKITRIEPLINPVTSHTEDEIQPIAMSSGESDAMSRAV